MMGNDGLRWFLRCSGMLINPPARLIPPLGSAGVEGMDGEPPAEPSEGGGPNGKGLPKSEVLIPTERSAGSDSLRTLFAAGTVGEMF